MKHNSSALYVTELILGIDRKFICMIRRYFGIIASCALVAIQFPVPAFAGPTEDAAAAQNRGDRATAAIINRALSHRGDDDALYRLGFIYRYGRGVERDYDEALKWFRRAAALGSAQAQFSVADMYLRGLSVSQNLLTAAKWYQRAAEQGHMQAQYVLGVLYKLGGGVRQNYNKAAEWFGRAATQGQPEAQHELGMLHSSGMGVRKDSVAAYKWELLARDNAENSKTRASAEEALAKLKSRMSTAQISLARRQASVWQAIPEGSGLS